MIGLIVKSLMAHLYLKSKTTKICRIQDIRQLSKTEEIDVSAVRSSITQMRKIKIGRSVVYTAKTFFQSNKKGYS